MSNDLKSALSKNPIAIVGMGAIFPQSKNLSEYWDNIVHEIDCITEVPPSRWNIDDYYDPDPAAPDKTYCKKGGFLPDIDFNPMEFGLPPNILEVTDAGQLLSLVVAKQTLADAGYTDMDAEMRNRTGCILGVAGGQKLIVPLASRLQYPIWDRVLESSGVGESDRAKIIEKIKLAYIPWEENSFPGLLANVISGRVANRFDFGGTNCVVDAACAASLAAVRMAIGELVDGRTDAMLTGGVDCDNSIFAYMSFSKTPAFSKKNHIRPFDAESDGMMIGEGVGMMMMRRLSDAERDGDQIYAVIKGIGSSSDGRYKSIYAPRSSGQAKAVVRAYEDAGVDPATINIVEAHGTGTPAGDPTEFAGLNEVFIHNNPERQYIGLGSVKSQIGHTKAAAGAASLIKIALALHHKILPPSIKIDQPHPKLDIENTPFYLNTESRPWIKPTDTPRRAAVSAFGFGGTNFHFVLEEYTPNGTNDHAGSYRMHSVAKSVLIAGKDVQAVVAGCKLQVAALQKDAEKAFAALPFSQPAQNEARVGFVAENAETATAHLQTIIKLLEKNPNAENWDHPKGIFYRQEGMNTTGKVVALFPGQGSQYVNMGKTVAMNFGVVREGFGRIDTERKQEPLSRTVYPIPAFDEETRKAQTHALRNTQHAQPAIGTLSYGFYKLLQNAGFKANFAAGHSFGELTALWAAGVFNDDDYFYLINERGRAMAAPNKPSFDAGTMLAVKGDIRQLKSDIPLNVTIANHNSHTQVVLAGSKTAIANAERVLDGKGYKVTPLSVSAAFHTEFVGHAQKPFARAIDQVEFNAPSIAVYSNSTGNAHSTDPQKIKWSLKEHVLQPVLFAQEIENIYAAGGSIFVEIGPRRVLTSLVEDILGDRPHVAIALNASRDKDSDLQLREAYTRLAVLGVPLDALDPHQRDHTPPATKPSPINVQLSGNNYVSPKTEAAYQNALSDGFTIKQSVASVAQPMKKVAPVANSNGHSTTVSQKISPAPTMPKVSAQLVNGNAKLSTPQKPITKAAPAIAKPIVPKKVESKKQPAAPIAAVSKPTRTQPSAVKRTMSETQLERSLALLHQHQADTLRVHEAFLETQGSYSAQVFALLSGQSAGGGQQAATTGTTSTEQPVAKSQNGVAAKVTSPSVQKVVQTPKPQNRVAQAVPKPVPAPVVQREVKTPSPAPTHVAELPKVAPPVPIVAETDTTSQVDVSGLADAMLEIVSEKTGYPAEMLELSMDMESDLGIDSIKRVEILGAMQEQHPELPSVDPSELSELRTLEEIVDHLSSAAGAVAPSSNGHVNGSIPASPQAQVSGNPIPETQAAPQADVSGLADAMLEIVSEKTGYPAEMLELSMDMESDLGIDSIKRVEILGAMQEQHPELPSVDPSELSELRTLEEIVNHLSSAAGAVAPSSNGHVNGSAPASPQAQVSGNGFPETQAAPQVDMSGLADAMLEIVSEKTGYPAEMLELGMDMESDLGIDSIKRVEILGAMQEQHPELPSVDPSELSELRTLEEIVDHLSSAAGAVAPSSNGHVNGSVPASPQAQVSANPIPETQATPQVDASGLADAMLEIVSEKTGYPAEMLELSMDMESDLGIDSIKRVEILGAMQEQHPELPSVDPSELSELRTLQEIVDHLALATHHAPLTTSPSPKADAAVAGAAQNYVADSVPAPTNHAITRQVVRLETLPMADFMEIAQPTGYVCLVTEGEIGRLVASALVARGWNVEMLPLGATFDESEIERQIGRFVKVNAFVHVDEGDAETRLKQLFFVAKHLKGKLIEAANETRPAFVTVTRMDGSLGLDEADFNPIHGGLFGLTKTLRLEWPTVYCRAVDLHPAISGADVASYVLAELFDPNKLISEVGYGNYGRVTLTTDEVALGSFTPSAEITRDSVFVVSGGAKGITADCVLYLAKQYQCKFVLLGRSAMDAVDDSWLGDYTDEAELKRLTMQHIIAQGEKPTPMAVNKLVKRIQSQREIAGTLAALHEVGSAAEYLSVDVTDAMAMQRELSAAQQRLGQITGMIHGAGVLSDKLIEKKTEWDFDSVYNTKVKGLNALLAAVPMEQLRHLVLFSSAAGFFGNAGQADYAIANDILNKFAHWANANHPNCHTVAINWGPWDGGMVTPVLKKLFAERNVPVIPIEVGAWILANELNEGVSQTVIGGELNPVEPISDLTLRKHRIHRHLRLDANPFLHDHVIGGNPVLPTVCAITWMANGCEQLYPGYSLFACDNYQVLKGIVFEPGLENRDCVLELEEVEKSADSIRIKAMIRSETPEGKPRFHYRAEITLLHTLPDVPIFEDFDLAEGTTFEGSDLYGSAVFHGPAFQGVQKVLNVTPERMTMKCNLAAVSTENQGQFRVQNFNPFIADGQYQSMVIWVWHYHDEAGSLPLMTKHGVQYRPVPFDTTAYTTMLVTGSSESKLICDLIAHDENGLVYSHVKGATVTISKALRELFIPKPTAA